MKSLLSRNAAAAGIVITGLLCGISSVRAAQYTIRLAATAAPTDTDPEFVALKIFEKEAEAATGNRVDVQIYPANQLGGTRGFAEGVSLGTIEMGNTGYDTIAIFARKANIFTMPYLHDSLEHYKKVIESPLGEAIHDDIAKASGIRVIGVLYRGPRQLMTGKRPVKKPEDLAGLRIRSPEAAINAGTVRAMGATPVPMSWSETYTALATGAVDGVENPLDVLASAKIQEVQKYLILTKHIYLGNALIINDGYFKALPEDVRVALKRAAAKASEARLASLAESEAKSLEAMRKAGVTVIDDPDTNAFAERAKAVWKQFTDGRDVTLELLEKVKSY